MDAALRSVDELLQHLLCLHRTCALRDPVLPDVPHLPWSLVQDRLGIDGGDLDVVGMGFIGFLHRGSEVVVPGLLLLDRHALGIARRQGFDQGALW